MSDSSMGMNLARIVHRVVNNPRGWRVDELMKELEIKDRTYRKYRKILMEQFIPFIEGGESILSEVVEDEHRFLRVHANRLAEQQVPPIADRLTALHLARQLMVFLEQTKLGREVDETLRELMSRVPNGSVLGAKFRNARRLFYHKPFGAKDYSGHNECLEQIVMALLFHRALLLRYRVASRDDEIVEREVYPLSLVTYREGLYLVATDPAVNERRIFAIDRVQNAQRTSTSFEYPTEDEYDPSVFFGRSFGLFRTGKPQRRVVELIFANESWIKNDLIERTWDSTQKFQHLPDGRLRMTFKPESLIEVRAWIASFGDHVEVVRPAPLDDPIWTSREAPDDLAAG